MVILVAGRDELVPKEHGDVLKARCKALGLNARRQVIDYSLHTEIMFRMEGRKAIVEAIHLATSSEETLLPEKVQD